jgi:hypothetical protein
LSAWRTFRLFFFIFFFTSAKLVEEHSAMFLHSLTLCTSPRRNIALCSSFDLHIHNNYALVNGGSSWISSSYLITVYILFLLYKSSNYST